MISFYEIEHGNKKISSHVKKRRRRTCEREIKSRAVHFPETQTFSSHAEEFDLLLLSPGMHFTFGKVPVAAEQSAHGCVWVSRLLRGPQERSKVAK